MSSVSWVSHAPLPTSSRTDGSPQITERESSLRERKDRKKQQQPRQLLSCTKCRERKVKCDRTKPCSACCARGLPKECHFNHPEGAEFGPIQQSLELRRLRAENQRLKERLLAAKIPLSDESDEDETSSPGRSGPSARRPSRQRRFRMQDQADSLYFGSPGLASVVAEFANLYVEPKSLTHAMPHGADMFGAETTMYPFPALWLATSATSGLLQCLEPHERLLIYLDSFARRGEGFAFPYAPEELSKKEVENFLEDAAQNAEMYPDVLALIFAAAALGIQLAGIEDDALLQVSEPGRRSATPNADIFIAASLQALRTSGFLGRPTLRSISALLIICPYLVNSGRFLDAWSLFGTVVRMAQAIGLHRNPKYLDPAPSLRESTLRSQLWWWMLHMDQLHSMTLGRPLGISAIGDCPPPEPLTTNPAALRLGEFVDQLTILGRQVLCSSQLTNSKIDMLTDKIVQLWDTIPDTLQFKDTWLASDTEIPEWPLSTLAAMHYSKIHSYIILLNRQRIENTRSSPDSESYLTHSFQPQVPSSHTAYPLDSPRHQLLPRGRPLVTQSCLAIVKAFSFFYTRVPSALIDWTISQQAFNGCMILLLDALETCATQNLECIEQTHRIFQELERRKLHHLACLASSTIYEGLAKLRTISVQKAADAEIVGLGEQTICLAEHRGYRHIDESASPIQDWAVPETQVSGYYSEPVMGATGMFLLEDQGLQNLKISRRPSMVPSHSHLPSPALSVAQPAGQGSGYLAHQQPMPYNHHLRPAGSSCVTSSRACFSPPYNAQHAQHSRDTRHHSRPHQLDRPPVMHGIPMPQSFQPSVQLLSSGSTGHPNQLLPQQVTAQQWEALKSQQRHLQTLHQQGRRN